MTSKSDDGSPASAHASDASPTARSFAADAGPVLAVALIAKLLLVLVVAWTAAAQPSDSPYLAPREGDASDVVWYLARGWDANSYQRMATEGWYDGFSRVRPLGYPMLVRAALVVVDDAQTAAVLVANLMSVVAVLLFVAVARRIVARVSSVSGDASSARVRDASALFALTPGVLAFGTVAYSESSQIACGLAAWWCLMRAEQGAKGPATRSLGWLACASLVFGVSVQMRHLGAPLVLALALFEAVRVLRARTGRSLAEAAALLWTAPLLALYFVWKFAFDDLDGFQREIFGMRFSFLGAPGGLLELDISVEHVLLIYMSLPFVLLLLARLRAVDGRLLLGAALTLLTALSFTGIAAQSFTRYAWAIWPLALGALTLRERTTTWTLSVWLGVLSLWCAVAHVQGSAAL